MRQGRLQQAPAWPPLRLWHRLLLGLLLGTIAGSVGALCSVSTAMAQTGPNQAGLVVLHGDGRVLTACIAFDEAEINGMTLLQRSGLDLNIDAGSGMGAVCRIDGEGCSVPQESCFCRCEGAGCMYWSYWRATAAGWEYSNLGAGSSVVRPGDVNGWVWGQGTTGGAANPPALTLADICQAAATATATPSATATATETPATTATPLPSATVTPLSTATATWAVQATVATGPPRIELFTADRVQLAAGEPATLQWRVVNAASVMLHAGGQAVAVDAAGATTLAPPYSVEVRLEASNDSGVSSGVVQLVVIAPTPTPSPASLPPAALTATPLPPATLAPVPVVPPTVGPVPVALPAVVGEEASRQRQPPEARLLLPVVMSAASNATAAQTTAMANVGATPTPEVAAALPASPLALPPSPPPPSPTSPPVAVTATRAPEATAIAAAVLPSIASTATTIGLPTGSAAAVTSQPAANLLGTALGALAMLLLLPIGIGTVGYLLWQAAKVAGKR